MPLGSRSQRSLESRRRCLCQRKNTNCSSRCAGNRALNRPPHLQQTETADVVWGLGGGNDGLYSYGKFFWSAALWVSRLGRDIFLGERVSEEPTPDVLRA